MSSPQLRLAVLRAYLLHPVGSVAREKDGADSDKFRRDLQEQSRRDEGQERGSWLVQVGARHLAAIDIYIREHTNLTDDAIGRLADCTGTHNKTR